jgi:hypothetical protein
MQMRYVRLLFGVLLAASALLVMSRSKWTGHLVHDDHTSIISLSVHPIWSPPPVPSCETFKQTFKDLPSEMAPGAVVVRVFEYDAAIFEFVLYGMAAGGICGILYLFTRRGGRDAVLHFALSITIGVVAAAAACFILWLVIGGWSPPFPFFFLLLGIGSGAYLGHKQWLKADTRPS